MNTDNKTRNMTVKGFLFKAGGKAANSAAAFLAQHRAFLETGDLCEVTSPILRLIDEQQLMPTPGLDLLKEAVLTHHLRAEVDKEERRLSEQNNPSGHTSKPWISRVFDSKGNLVVALNSKGEEVELEKTFQLASDADRWSDLRLVENASDCFAVVEHTKIMRADGTPISTVIMRQDALSRILKAKKHPFSKKTGGRDSRLSFGVKAVQSRATFSHG
jgi:hypothetical protein